MVVEEPDEPIVIEKVIEKVDESGYISFTELFQAMPWFATKAQLEHYVKKKHPEIRRRHLRGHTRLRLHVGDFTIALLGDVLSPDPDIRETMLAALATRLDKSLPKAAPPRKSKSGRRK